MKRIILALAVVGTLALLASGTAEAGHRDHARLHDRLEHRAFHRDLIHRAVHRYPMTWRQHGRLHDTLDHDAYHDRLEHRSYHRRRSQPRFYFGQRSGFGFGGRGFYIRFGH